MLVERHGPMVLSVCRKTLDDPHDADDALQATFLVLAKKAGSVRKADSVASWLHGVALRVAARARAERASRRENERRGALMKEKERESSDTRPENWPELHEEIARLPAHYREPVVLCYLEGLSADLAAQRIGCPRGTVLSRLSRARERLRGRLLRRGSAPPVTLSLESMSPEAPAVPAALLESTVQVSLDFGARSITAIATGATTPVVLARGVLHAMIFARLKVFAAAALGALVIAAGAGAATLIARQDKAPLAPPPAPQTSETAESKTRDMFAFEKVGLSADDLVEAAGLDIYKFRVDLKRGERFKVEYRACESKDSASREIVSHPFQVTEEGPTIIRLSFLRRDGKLSGFLLSNEPDAFYRLIVSGGAQGGISTIVDNPLKIDVTGRRGLLIARSDKENTTQGDQENVLVRVCESKATRGVDLDGYPRAEVVLIKSK